MGSIIRYSERKVSVSYNRVFRWRNDPGCGFGFACDEEGNIFPGLTPEAKKNLDDCLNGTFDVVDIGVRRSEQSYRGPALFQCDCGHTLSLAAFTNTCAQCGRDYNMSGQLLAPRSQWGEETGETADEILNIGHHVG